MDPRVRWEAEYAPSCFDVTVLGFYRDELPVADRSEEMKGGYRTIRLTRQRATSLLYLLKVARLEPAWRRALFFLGGLVLLPVLFLLEVGSFLLSRLRKAYPLFRRIPGVPFFVRSLRASGIGSWIRTHLVSRVYYFIAIMQQQFAPATMQFSQEIASMEIKPDIIHCNDLDTLQVGVEAKRLYGCRVIYDAHEFYPVSNPEGRWIDITLLKWVEATLIRRADTVITVNPLLADLMAGAYRLQHVGSVPNAEPWIPLTEREHQPSPMGQLAKGRTKFLFQGRFTPGRGIEELIRGWKSVDGTRAVLFLRGPDNVWKAKAKEQAEELGILGKSLFFLPAVTEDELVCAAAQADVGIIPYRPLIINDKFACPNKMSQYLHAGLAVLANDLPYVRSVLDAAEAGEFYTSKDVETLASAVHRLLDEPGRLKQMSANASAYAETTFNWQAQAQDLYNAYA